jgi:hypothetical protein
MLGLVVLLSGTAEAGVIFTSAGATALRYGDGFSLGSRFVVETYGIEVTAMGLYDSTGNGFLQSHEIALWDVSDGNLEVVDSTIPVGTTATLVSGFRYVTLDTPVFLNQGDIYILAAFYPTGETLGVNDQLRDCCGGTSAATDPNFGSFLAAFTTTGLASSAGHLTEPNGTTSGTDYVGPNFEFIATPEPEGIVMALMGFAALLAARTMRRRLLRTLQNG